MGKIVESVFRLAGGLSLFLFGLKVMSDALQRAAGKRMKNALNFMTANRLTGVLSGLVVTAIVQSSSAVTVIVVSFVGAGLLTLQQAIGVIMGANIGTTFTAWIVAALGFKVKIAALALPSIAIGFIIRSIKWKRPLVSAVSFGDTFLGLGILFLGLDFLTGAVSPLDAETIARLSAWAESGLFSIVVCVVVGAVLTALMNSSSAMTAIIITLAYEGMITFEMACAMVLGANIGTTINAPLAAIGAGSAALRAALVHVLFNTIGAVICIFLFRPMLYLVGLILPGELSGELVTLRIAVFHTAFNIIATIAFLPFIKQFARLITFLVKDKPSEEAAHYTLDIPLSMKSPELTIVRAEKEIRDLAALVFDMYEKLRAGLDDMNLAKIEALCEELKKNEEHADIVREELTKFLMETSRTGLSPNSEHNVALLMRIIADLEDMTDDCFSIGMLLQRAARKNIVFREEMDALTPYMSLVESFLNFVREHLGGRLAENEVYHAREFEDAIDSSRDKLRKLAQKQIEAGKNVKLELTFIDLVRRLERIGDFCNGIASALSDMTD